MTGKVHEKKQPSSNFSFAHGLFHTQAVYSMDICLGDFHTQIFIDIDVSFHSFTSRMHTQSKGDSNANAVKNAKLMILTIIIQQNIVSGTQIYEKRLVLMNFKLSTATYAPNDVRLYVNQCKCKCKLDFPLIAQSYEWLRAGIQ